MKRDMDLVRRILLDVEADKLQYGISRREDEPSIEMPKDDLLIQHILLLQEANLLKIERITYSTVYVEGLTWEGHDFTNTVRDPEIWRQTQSAASQIGGAGFKIFMEIGKGFVKQKLQELGIPIP